MKTLLIVALLQSFAFADEAPEYDRWAALAFSRSQAASGVNPVSRVFNEDSESQAKKKAIRACGDYDCEIKMYVETGCIGVAQGVDPETGSRWWGFGAAKYLPYRIGSRVQTPSEAKTTSRKKAALAAIAGCKAGSHASHCRVSEVFCTWED